MKKNSSNRVYTADSLSNRLNFFEIKPRKRLGQHFLVNQGTLLKIIEAAELNRDDLVIEVGAGLGVLTSELKKIAGEVLALEIDDKLVSVLKQMFIEASNVKIIKADVLDVPVDKLLSRHLALPMIGKRYKVVANIPYYITSPIIHHFLDASIKPSLMVLMVQKEVGQQIIASPGKSNLLNLSIQLYAHARLISKIPAGNFYPRPKVDSAILRLDVYDKPRINEEEIHSFFRIARAGFSTPRKQIKNSLAHGLNIKPVEIVDILKEAGISPERRPQTLAFKDWERLMNAFLKLQNIPLENENKSTGQN